MNRSGKVDRRGFIAAGAGTGLALTASAASALDAKDVAVSKAVCTTVPDMPSAVRPDPQSNWRDFSPQEVAIAFRNHAMQAEFLREPITPLGAHYLLIHFDVPQLSATDYSITIDGRVRNPRRLSLADLKTRQSVTQASRLISKMVGYSRKRRVWQIMPRHEQRSFTTGDTRK